MKIIDKGHRYLLKNNRKETYSNTLIFYKDPIIHGEGYDGTTNQEVIRALIDRIKFLNSQKPHEINSKIIYHLRMALALHEIRHIERFVEEGYPIEKLNVYMNDLKNDHFIPNKKNVKKEK